MSRTTRGTAPPKSRHCQPTPIDLWAAKLVLGKRIKARRAVLAISQEALADRSGLHWTFVGQVERGKRNISLHNMLKLASGLGE
jgi:DNA-binding XRE family transcriptional regulator